MSDDPPHSSESAQEFKRGETLAGDDLIAAVNSCETNNALPKDSVFHIFTFLTRKELKPCKLVCKLWRVVSSEYFFGWFPMVYFSFSGSDNMSRTVVGSRNYFELPSVSHKPTIAIESIEDGEEESKTTTKLITPKKGDPFLVYYTHPKYRSDAGQHPEYFLELAADYPKLWRFSFHYDGNAVDQSKHGAFYYSYYSKKQLHAKKYCMLAELNTRQLDIMVNNGEEIPAMQMIVSIIEDENKQFMHNRCFSQMPKFTKQAIIPTVVDTPAKQPSGLAAGVGLYKYQLNAVEWMKSIEKPEEFHYTTLIPWKAPLCDSMLDFKKKQFVKSADVSQHVKTFKARGGILADDVGLGKTLEMISLILAAPPMIKEDLPDDLLFNSSATLVVCPGHLTAQWKQEIDKRTSPQLVTIVVIALSDLKAYTYMDFAHADVIIVSIQLLKNNNYRHLSVNTAKANSNYTGTALERQLKAIRAAPMRGVNLFSPMFEHFKFCRVIVDEAHEIVDKSTKAVTDLAAEHWWYVSATPFPTTSAYDHMLQFFEVPDFPQPLYTFYDYITNNLMWRNTKESVKDEYEIPPVVQEVLLLDFTDVEDVYYQRNNYYATRDRFCNVFSYHETISSFYTKILEEAEERVKFYTTGYYATARYYDSERDSHLKYVEALKNCKYSYTDKTDFTDVLANFFEKEKGPRVVQDAPTSTSTPASAPLPADDEKAAKISALAEKQQIANVAKLTVAELKEELTKRNIPVPKGAKSVLVKLMQDTISAEQGKGSGGETKQEKGKAKGKAKVDEEEKPEPKRTRGKKAQVEEPPKPTKRKAAETVSTSTRRGKKAKTEKDEDEELEETAASTTSSASAPSTSASKSRHNDILMEQKLLRYLVHRHGTKQANLLMYLRKMWKENPSHRIIIFSREHLTTLSDLLTKYGEDTAIVDGNTTKRAKALTAFKAEDSPLRVVLLSLTTAASGTNLIEADHILFYEQLQRNDAHDTEVQAIGRAHRQGQNAQVVVAKLIVRNTNEHNFYLKQIIAQQPPDAMRIRRGTSIIRTNSIETIIANSPSLQKTGSVLGLLEASKGDTAPIPFKLIDEPTEPETTNSGTPPLPTSTDDEKNPNSN